MHRQVVALFAALLLAAVGYWVFAHRTVPSQAVSSANMTPDSGPASPDGVNSTTTAALQHVQTTTAHPAPRTDPFARYASATDLFQLAQEFRGNAEHGDPDVAAALAELEDECWMYVANHGDRSDIPRVFQEKDPTIKPWVDAMLARTAARCRRFTRSDLMPVPQIRKLVSDAAAQGSAEAKARLLMGSDVQQMPDDVLARSVGEILDSGDPAAIVDLSQVMGTGVQNRENRDQLFGVPSGSETETAAYLVAACRMGYDCGPGSLLLDNLCFSGIGCGYPSVDALVRDRMLTPAQYRAMQREVPLILARTQHH